MSRQSFQRTEIRHHVDDGQSGVQTALLWQVAKPVEMLAASGHAKHTHLTAVRADDVHENANEGALPGAVWPKQTKYFAGMNIERDAAECGRPTVRLFDAGKGQNGHCGLADYIPRTS